MVSIALIGYGYWGPNVAKNLYSNKEICLVGICDHRESRLKRAKEIYANELEYEVNFERFLERKDIDALAIAVETENHYEIAKAALQAGKHIYVEKPLTNNVEQAEELGRLAKEKGLIVHVDHIMVYHSIIQKVKEVIDKGEIGDIIYFDCSRINLGNIKEDVSAMWDLSVHDLSIIDYLSNGALPIVVKAMGKKVGNEKHILTFLLLEYEKFIANIKASWFSPIKERKIIVAGTKKMIVFDDMKIIDKLIIYDKGVEQIKLYGENPIEYEKYALKTRAGDGIIPYVKEDDALYNSIDHFIECIRTGKESMTNAEAAIRIIKILAEADTTL